MVGEIRDEETAQIAVQSALTGHLVFTTVHANNVVDVLGRFLNMNVDLYNFVSALNCVLAQRWCAGLHALPAGAPAEPAAARGERPRSGEPTRQIFYEGAAASSATAPGFSAGWRSPSCSTSRIASAS